MKIGVVSLVNNIFASAVLVIGGVLFFRLLQVAFEPGNLYRAGHIVLVSLFLSWSLWLNSRILREGSRAKPQWLAQWFSWRTTEFLALFWLSLIIVSAFLLVAAGKAVSGGVHVGAMPFVNTAGPFLQAVWGALLVLVPVWCMYFLLERVLPHRGEGIYPAAVMLCCMGLAMLYRIGPDIAVSRGLPGFSLLFWRQYVSLLVAIGGFLFCLWFFSGDRVDKLTRKRYLYGALCILLISLTALFGTEQFGRKLSISVGSQNFQTVELVKLLALFFMVSYFRFEGHFIQQGQSRLGLPRGRFLIPYVAMWGLVLLPIFLQRDLGPTALLFALFLVMLYLGTGSLFSVLSGFGMMLVLGTLCYVIGFPSMVRTRLDMWFDPFSYSQNITESLWAISSGGWFGTGIGQGMAYRIPVVWSDFTYAVIVEELGVLGGGAIVLTFFAVGVGTLRSAVKNKRDYGQLLLAGTATLWLLQAAVIIGGNMGVLPLTGITLPFVSYGGSSLIMNWISLALVLVLSGQCADASVVGEHLKKSRFTYFSRRTHDAHSSAIHS